MVDMGRTNCCAFHRRVVDVIFLVVDVWLDRCTAPIVRLATCRIMTLIALLNNLITFGENSWRGLLDCLLAWNETFGCELLCWMFRLCTDRSVLLADCWSFDVVALAPWDHDWDWLLTVTHSSFSPPHLFGLRWLGEISATEVVRVKTQSLVYRQPNHKSRSSHLTRAATSKYLLTSLRTVQ